MNQGVLSDFVVQFNSFNERRPLLVHTLLLGRVFEYWKGYVRDRNEATLLVDEELGILRYPAFARH